MQDAGRTSALQGRGVVVRLGTREVLQGVDVDFTSGKWTSIVGPNGAGKSTLLKALAGLLPCGGEVRLLDRPLSSYAGRERARLLAWLGQNESSADDLTVHDVVMLGRLPHRPWLASPGDDDRHAVERALRATQGWDWRERALSQLSGGERQRVLLARALAVEARVLLLDEPLANLDPPHQADWLALTRTLVRDGATVVSVLHELPAALQADEMLVLDQGRVAHHGHCADPSAHRALEAVFDQRIAVHSVAGQWVTLPRT